MAGLVVMCPEKSKDKLEGVLEKSPLFTEDKKLWSGIYDTPHGRVFAACSGTEFEPEGYELVVELEGMDFDLVVLFDEIINPEKFVGEVYNFGNKSITSNKRRVANTQLSRFKILTPIYLSYI